MRAELCGRRSRRRERLKGGGPLFFSGARAPMRLTLLVLIAPCALARVGRAARRREVGQAPPKVGPGRDSGTDLGRGGRVCSLPKRLTCAERDSAEVAGGSGWCSPLSHSQFTRTHGRPTATHSQSDGADHGSHSSANHFTRRRQVAGGRQEERWRACHSPLNLAPAAAAAPGHARPSPAGRHRPAGRPALLPGVPAAHVVLRRSKGQGGPHRARHRPRPGQGCQGRAQSARAGGGRDRRLHRCGG